MNVTGWSMRVHVDRSSHSVPGLGLLELLMPYAQERLRKTVKGKIKYLTVSAIEVALILWVYAGCPRAIIWPVDLRVGIARVDGDLTSGSIRRQLHDFHSRFVAVFQRKASTKGSAHGGFET